MSNIKYPRKLRDGEFVRVYRNLHNGKLSVMAININGDMTVVAHTESVCIKDAKLTVNETGRQRVIREKQKNVHAFVSGRIVLNAKFDNRDVREVTYNPYKYESFVYKEDETPIHKADAILINGDGKIYEVV